jgi:hypothetical protein
VHSPSPSDDPVVTLQARAIVDLETRIAELVARVAQLDPLEEQVRHRDATISALQQRVNEQDELLGVYQRSRAVRLASMIRRLQAGAGNGAVRSRRMGG